MKGLKTFFESLGYINVATYLNSGNVIFETDLKKGDLQNEIPKKLKKKFGFEIQALVKNEIEIKKIAQAIPKNWKNDPDQKTDVAYLFSEIDSKKIIGELPIKKKLKKKLQILKVKLLT